MVNHSTPSGPDARTPEQAPAVLAFVRDLMMGSRITAAAREAGAAVRMVRDLSRLRELSGRRLIVDLNEAGAIPAAVEWKQRTGGEVIGFVSHVDAATIQQARAAGVDQVLPRSRFVADLPRLLVDASSR